MNKIKRKALIQLNKVNSYDHSIGNYSVLKVIFSNQW